MKPINTVERIKELLNQNTLTDITSGCWLYQGSPRNTLGYCKIRFNGKKTYIHRLSAHIYWNFDLDSPMLILHIRECPNKNCWNPNHLYEGTHRDNMLDAIAVGTHNFVQPRSNFCKLGHPLDGLRGNGKRYCLTCNRIRAGYNE